MLTILKQKTEKRAITLDHHLELDLGLDSLGRAELMVAVEEEFAIKIDEEEFFQLSTVAEVIETIEKYQRRGQKSLPEQEHSWEELLHRQPPDVFRKRIELSASSMVRFFTTGGAFLLDPLLKSYCKLKVYGQKHLGMGPALICLNHTSYLDGFIIFSAVPLSLRHHLFFLGYGEYFEAPLLRSLIKLLKVIPVKPSSYLVETMQVAAFILHHGKSLCIFLEGARSISGEMQEFKRGVGILAKELGVQIIPTYISGTHHAWKPGTWFPKPSPVTVIFGRHHSPAELEEQGRKLQRSVERYEAVSVGLRAAVLRLKQEFETLQHDYSGPQKPYTEPKA